MNMHSCPQYCIPWKPFPLYFVQSGNEMVLFQDTKIIVKAAMNGAASLMLVVAVGVETRQENILHHLQPDSPERFHLPKHTPAWTCNSIISLSMPTYIHDHCVLINMYETELKKIIINLVTCNWHCNLLQGIKTGVGYFVLGNHNRWRCYIQ